MKIYIIIAASLSLASAAPNRRVLTTDNSGCASEDLQCWQDDGWGGWIYTDNPRYVGDDYDINGRAELLDDSEVSRDQLYEIDLPGKSILRDYFQENRTSRRPFLLLRISFPGRPIFIQFVPRRRSRPRRWGRWRRPRGPSARS